MNRTLSRIALGVIAAAALFAVACGGGGGGSSPLGGDDFNKDPTKFAQAYYLAAFRVFTGATTAEDMMKFFEESCRNKVDVADVAKGIEKSRDLFPKLKGAKVEELDFQGKAKVEKTANGAKVTIPGPGDARVKVDGKFQNAFEYFKSVDLADDKDKNETNDIELVLVNGRYYDADCSNLTDIADSGKRASRTPTPPRGTATPSRTTPTVTTGNRTPTPSGTTRAGAPSSLSNADVESFTKAYFVMLIGAYSGQTKAADVMNFYTSDCRSKVTTANVTSGLTKLAGTYPKMKGDKIEDLDFQGKLKITPRTGGGFDVVVPGSREVRVKVNGQFVNLHTYALGAGIENASDTGNETSNQSFKEDGGKLFDADCDLLTELASGR